MSFFQVRYATVQRIAQSEKTGRKVFGGKNAKDLLKAITQKVIEQQKETNSILTDIESDSRFTVFSTLVVSSTPSP